MKTLPLLPLALLGLAPRAQESEQAPPAAAVHDVWFADFDKAVEAARASNKDLFVDFTGSDWCGWCIRLHEEVFQHQSFLDGVQKSFVLVALDYPRGDEAKAKVPNPERNEDLQQKYAIQGFPTILLMTPDGDVFGKTGYRPGGPDAYLAAVNEMATTGKKRVAEIRALVAQFATEDAAVRAEKIATAVDMLAGMTGDDVGVDKVAEIARHGMQAEDAALVEKAVTALIKSGQGDDATAAKARELDADNGKGLLELVLQAQMMQVRDDASAKAFLGELDKLLELGGKDDEVIDMMLFNATRWSAGPLRDPEMAKKYGQKLKDRVEGTERAERFQQLFEAVLGK